MRIAMRQPRWAVAPVAAGLVLVMLLGAVAAGLRVPGFAFLSGLPGFGLLDYRTLSGSAFAPLRADYLDQLLGTGFGDEGAAAGVTEIPATASLDTVLLGTGPLLPFGDVGRGPQAAPAVLDHQLTNDDMDNPVVISRLPFAARTDTTRATRQEEEPRSCSQTGVTTWYRYTADRDGLLSADTFGSDHATAVGVFKGTSLAALEQVGCATGPTGNAQAAFAAARGGTYLFQVAGVVTGGRLVFHLGAPGSTSQVPASGAGRAPTHVPRWSHVSGNGQVVVYETGSTVPDASGLPCCGQIYALDRRTGRTSLISRSSDGNPGNDYSEAPRVSYDGRYVAFASYATNLVDGDTNGSRDLFVHDRRSGTTVRASVGSRGEQGTARNSSYGIRGSISADGRFVSFYTGMGGLVEDDPPGSLDLFVRDLRTGVTTRESVDEAGNPANGLSADSRISADGRYVAFLSFATNLAPARYRECDWASYVLANCGNVFLRDRWKETTQILSVDAAGNADMDVEQLAMSDDGGVIAWTTRTALEPGDTNGLSDVYVVTRSRPSPHRVSLSSDGKQQDDPGGAGRNADTREHGATGRAVDVSADGTRVAFDSRSTNLVPGDSNGASDIFLRDLRTGSTTRVSVSSSGAESDGDSHRPALSGDGSVIVFESEATDLVRGDSNMTSDIYVHDRRVA